MRALRRSALALLLSLGAALLAAPSQALPYGYYSVPYSDTLYHHADTLEGSSTITAPFSMWHRDGLPTPTPAPVEYVAYPWSPEIYAVHFFGPGRQEWVWTKLTYAQWVQVGRPTPRPAAWIPGTWYHSYSTSPEVFAIHGGTWHKLTRAEWDAAAWGYPPENQFSWGVYRYSWHPTIAVVDGKGIGRPLTYPSWAAQDFPTPKVVASLGTESIYRYPGSPDLHLTSPIVGSIVLTFDQWVAMGRPAPQN